MHWIKIMVHHKFMQPQLVKLVQYVSWSIKKYHKTCIMVHHKIGKIMVHHTILLGSVLHPRKIHRRKTYV